MNNIRPAVLSVNSCSVKYQRTNGNIRPTYEMPFGRRGFEKTIDQLNPETMAVLRAMCVNPVEVNPAVHEREIRELKEKGCIHETTASLSPDKSVVRRYAVQPWVYAFIKK